ncbi:MAG: hypothetical protein VB091_09780 [Christensenella sp.]|nr:hypothetical protein [Christensenella sp.]
MRLLSTMFDATRTEAMIHSSSTVTWKTLQTGFLVRGLFFLLVAVLLIATLVFLLQRLRRAPKTSSSVEFSTVKQTMALNRKSAIAILVLIGIFVLMLSMFQLTMALLLQIDRTQNMPTEQTIVESVQSKNTLAGRIILFDKTMFFDAARVISEPPDALNKYQISYLKNSHVITQFQELP